MKILQLRFKNLNSLIGEWKIDFTATQYVSEGIFTISGPTGAGKSTILDAICLALYGRTPRLNNISASTNEIMSRKTGECLAEVIFESQKGTFISCWSQTKARKSATGNLQQPKFEISDYKTGKVISSQKTNTLSVVIENTGMDFNRFTQAMMLAQGGFAAFLKASADERAPILEQITGTAIYTTISQMVYGRYKDESNRLEILQAETSGIVILKGDELIALETELAEKVKLEQKQSALKVTLDTSIKWLNDIELLKKELMSIEQEQVTQQLELEAFVPERERLEKASKALELEADYAMLTNERTLQNRAIKQLAEAEQTLPQLKAALEIATNEKNSTADVLKKVIAETSLERIVINKVREIDVNISHQKTALRNALEDISQKTKQKNKLAATISTFTNDVLAKQKEQENANQYLENNKSDALLLSEMGAISASFNTLLQSKTSLGNLQLQMNKLRGEWNNESKKLTTEAQRVEFENANLKQIAEKVIEIQETIKFLLNNRTLSDYRYEQELLSQKLMLIREIESLEQKRRQLEDNKECPLCGSLHHPFAEGNIPASNDTELRAKELNELIIKIETNNGALALAEKEEQQFKNQLLVAETSLKITQNNITRFETDIATEKDKEQQAEKEYNTLKTQIITTLLPFGIVTLTDGAIQETEFKLKNRLAQWKINTDIKDKIDTIINELKAKIVTQTALLLSEETNLQAANVNSTKLDTELQKLISERRKVFGDKDTTEEDTRLDSLLNVATTDERKKDDVWKDLNFKYKHLTKLIEDLTIAISDRKMPLHNLETTFQQLLLKADFSGEVNFIEARLPKDQKDQLSAKEKTLNNKKLDIESRKKDRNGRLTTEEEKKLTEVTLEDLMEQSGEIAKEIEVAKERKATIAEQLRANNEGLKKIEEVLLQINIQKTIAVKWGNLSTLIGSADGKKFRNFAQGLTFEIMVSYANKQLTKLTDRYLLIRDKEEPLNLNVIDNYQAGECRSTKNLSGGESFYISLALALGLSSMSSKNVRVDSLFLDEGFGTLDEETLEIALETLASLRQDGKLIGVISHVSSLKDRINTKIEVVKGSSGNSLLVGAGCERLA